MSLWAYDVTMPQPLPPPLPPAAQVEDVIVHPPRLPPLGGQAVFAVQQIGADALKTAPRLDEALKQAPGVSLFRRTGSDAANPTIQGLSLRSIAPSGAGRALVTLEGAPQNDPFGGWVIWSALPPEGLDGATIVRGAGAGPYGAGALTGVVALQERGASDGLAVLESSFSERGGARRAGAGGSETLLLVGSYEASDGFVPVRGPRRGAADQPTDLESWSFSVRGQHRIHGVDTALRLSAFEEKRGAGLAGAASRATGGSAALTLATSRWRVQGWVRSSDLANTSVAVAANRATTTPANNQYSTPAIGYGFNAALQGQAGDWAWETGLDARVTEGETQEFFRFLNGGFTRGRVAGGKTAVAGAYGEASLERGPLTVLAGARIDAWSNKDAFRRERDTASGLSTLDQRPAGDSGTTPTGRIGVRYAIADGLWLRGAAYAGFRPPTLNELHRPFRVGNDITEANAGLTPETLLGAEAGIGGEGWSGTVFYNRLKDPIANVTIGVGPFIHPVAGLIPAGGVLRQRRNAGSIEAWGLEGDWARDLTEDLSLRAAFSATRAEVDGGASAPQLTGLRPAQVPELTATAGAEWRASSRLTLSGDLRYESARFEDDLNTRKLAPALGVDVRAGWRFGRGREVYIAADNVFDAEVETGETADGVESFAAPRTVRVGLSIRR